MLTVDALREFGADVADGLGRCMNNEGFYLKLVNMALDDGGFDKLSQALETGDVKEGFEAAHALKGILANLSLTPLLTPVSEMTEILRAGSAEGCAELCAAMTEKRNELLSLRGE